MSRFSQDRNAFYNFVRSAEYEAPDFAPEGPKWHQQIFGPILAGALQLRPGMRSSAAELLELIKELDTENKQRKVYAAKLESANQLRDKLKNEIKKLQEAMMEETMVEDQKSKILKDISLLKLISD